MYPYKFVWWKFWNDATLLDKCTIKGGEKRKSKSKLPYGDNGFWNPSERLKLVWIVCKTIAISDMS